VFEGAASGLPPLDLPKIVLAIGALGGWPVLSRSEGRGCSAGALSLAKGGMLMFAYAWNSSLTPSPQRNHSGDL